MARQTASSPAARLKMLERARARAKKVPRGKKLTANPMAGLLGVSWPTLKGWCREIPGFEASGVFEGGAQGIEYQFKPIGTINFLVRHFRAEQDKRIEASRRLAKMTGAEDLIAEDVEFSPEDLNKLLGLYEKIEAHKIRQGELLPGEKTRSDFNTYHLTIQQAALRSAQEEDPEGNWPPEMRKLWDARSRKLLVEIQRAGRKCAGQLGAKNEPAIAG